MGTAGSRWRASKVPAGAQGRVQWSIANARPIGIYTVLTECLRIAARKGVSQETGCGFWPGLGAKSWSSVAAIQVLHSSSYADKCYFYLGEWGCLNLHG